MVRVITADLLHRHAPYKRNVMFVIVRRLGLKSLQHSPQYYFGLQLLTSDCIVYIVLYIEMEHMTALKVEYKVDRPLVACCSTGLKSHHLYVSGLDMRHQIHFLKDGF